ncbi:hypothetical protein TW91_1014 [Neisseria flavescens]|nr:hypothetical protein TW91_1014 [Neisseria flavescens]
MLQHQNFLHLILLIPQNLYKHIGYTFSLKQQNHIFAKALKNQNSIIAEQPRKFSDGLSLDSLS